MKHLLFFILLVAFGCQRTTVNGQQTPCTVPEPVEGTASGASTSSATAYPRTVDCCPLSVDYYEKQIHIADSLYKNYLPQYNFDEVKAAMEFFDSLRLSKTTDNGQRTTDFVHRIFPNKRQRTMCTVPEPVEGTISGASASSATAYPRTVDCCPLTVDIDFIYAKAHYYHAVGLTERDDIVGACEHYLIALEIMEDMMANDKSLKTNGKKSVDCCPLSVDNPEDYEKIRFLALTYTRLGRLFLNENYCDLAIAKYRKALKYVKMIDDIPFKSNIHKELGNSYQLANKPDSALYYYGESLRYNSSLPNRLDVEKSIAKILFHKGEKDSAYVLLKNNLREIDNENLKYSYHCTLGDVYYSDKKYDSALYYLETSLDNDIVTKKVAFTSKLSAIYDSLGDYDKRDYYDNFSVKMFLNHANKEVDNKQLQVLYDNYKERKNEREKIKSRTRTKVIAKSLSLLIIVSFVIIILIWHKSKRKDILHQESLNEKDRYIANKEEIISKTNEEVKQKESEIKNLVEIIDGHKSDINSLKNELSIKEHEISCKETDIRKMENDLSAKEIELEKLQKNVHENSILIDRLSENHKTNEELMIAYIEEIEKLKTEIDETRNNLRDIRFRSSLIEGKINSKNTELQKKEEEINRYKLELSEYKNKLEIISSDNNDNAYTPKIGMDLYLQSKVCSKILNEINELSERNRDANILTPLKQEELVMLLNSASFYVNNFTNGIACKYSKLKKEDLYYLSLALIGLKDKQISSLLGVTYNSIRIRKKNLCSILGIKNDELQSFLMNICN